MLRGIAVIALLTLCGCGGSTKTVTERVAPAAATTEATTTEAATTPAPKRLSYFQLMSDLLVFSSKCTQRMPTIEPPPAIR